MTKVAGYQQHELVLEARPFLKWAGGKGNLIPQIDQFLPQKLKDGKIKRYIEPFVGGGALFLHIARSYEVEEYIISDANPELYVGYCTIKNNVDKLIRRLQKLQKKYMDLDEEARKEWFYEMRDTFNKQRIHIRTNTYQVEKWVKRTAQLIFLNQTCYNGLFRVNSKGFFNVPFGRYKKPKICNESNLKALSKVLAKTTILLGDFQSIEDYVDNDTFVYFDPPYRPISKSSSFNSYAKDAFNDYSQKRLAEFCRNLHKKGVYWMLSNSDPKNTNPEDNFFEEIFDGFQIERIKATRKINSKASKRGVINELLIMNTPIAETIVLPVKNTRRKKKAAKQAMVAAS